MSPARRSTSSRSSRRKENILFGRDNVVATPHLGAATTEAQENVALQIAEQMADFLMTGAVANALNMPSLSAEEAKRLKPYMKLAEQLGSFAGQLTESGLKRDRDRVRGPCRRAQRQAADRDRAHRPAGAAARRGQHGQCAGDLPRARHPRQRDAPRRAVDYQTLIRVTRHAAENAARAASPARCSAATSRASSTVEGIALEAELGPHMLFVRNQDKPGFIGNLGRTLGEAGGQHRDIPSRPHGPGEGRDLPGPGRSALGRSALGQGARHRQCGPGGGAAFLILSFL